MDDFLFRGSLQELDPPIHALAQLEAERQYRKLILIPSESTAPVAVREALATAFHNIYAEGYPSVRLRGLTESDLLDYPSRLGEYRRYSDPRYYKGVEYADLLETLVQRRCAELFAANNVSPDELYVNVQPLSGAPANNAIYHALVKPGETIMGMDLLHGGHLTHGSPANRSGKYYNAVQYTIDPETERLDYDAMEALAREHRPAFIIAGFSSYPWAVDWARYRAIADAVGAYLFADIAHVAGLVAGEAYPSPVGFADVIAFTTHKTLGGPRGACILTTDRALARKIDRAVFPGEQGGPHVNVFAALALSFKLAATPEFRALQAQTVKNCIALTERLMARGLRVPFGGTETHLTNLDCTTITGPDGASLSGDQAARILDLADIVVNRNTIPGDRSAFDPSGIRLGTPWVTQRGLKESHMAQVADIIADVLEACTPYLLPGRKGFARRAKVDFSVLEEARLRTRALATTAGFDLPITAHGYPHFYYLDDQPESADGWSAYEIGGERAGAFLNLTLESDLEELSPGESQVTSLHTAHGKVSGTVTRLESGTFRLHVPSSQGSLAANWLRALSDGYVYFDADLRRKIPGPVWVRPSESLSPPEAPHKPQPDRKPYFVGIPAETPVGVSDLAPFEWEESQGALLQTPLHGIHRELGAKLIPFAGWDMPVWYTSVMEEHLAVREAAGLFDVAHMGVYQAEGPDSSIFLDSVCGNDIASLALGESLYTHFLDPDANVIDDLLVYRRGPETFLVVVNASNDDKNWAWLNAVRTGKVLVDRQRPWSRAYGRGVHLRNLRDPAAGSDMRVDLALQGPHSRDILLALGCDSEARKRIQALGRTQLTEATVGGYDLVISRTGYTGERMAFELFVHPDQAAGLWMDLLEAGEPLGLKPCGLGARDSLRTEAGLPLYGHEMGGDLNLGVGEAGFGWYVKTYKPWFIGRDAFLARESARSGVVVRFRFDEKGVRMAHLGDPVVDKRGRTIGTVTSCAVDREGFLTGQAYLGEKFTASGTRIYVFQGADRAKAQTPAGLKPGDRIAVPNPATVVSRFPR